MSRKIYILIALIVALIAGGYRVYAANRLKVDFDEPTYLARALEYASYLKEGNYSMLVMTNTTYEHPAFYKILYGVVLLTQPPPYTFESNDLIFRESFTRSKAAKFGMADRYLATFWGTLAAAVLALANPLAGLFLALQTLSVKFTSEIYVEALPLLTSLLCVLTYLRWFENVSNPSPQAKSGNAWLVASAVFFGIIAASKYVYCVAGLGIVIHFLVALLQKQIPKRALAWLFGWGFLSIVCFFMLDPYLWVDTFNRLIGSLSFHFRLQDKVYLESLVSKKGGYPFWQPILWLLSPASFYDLGPNAVFKINIDALIFAFALLGLPRFFQKQRVFFYWFLVGMVFLLLWGAKWPQYILIVLVPFSLAAAEGVLTLWIIGRKLLLQDKQPTS